MANKSNIKLWVDALKSKRFTRGHGVLEVTDQSGIVRNCCLGVACRVAIDNGVSLNIVKEDSNGISLNIVKEDSDTHFNGHSAYLPDVVADWLGIDLYSPKVTNLFCVNGPVKEIELAVLNDTDHSDKGFDRIAKCIEATWLTDQSDPQG